MVPQLEALAITQQGFNRKVVVVIIVEGLSKKYGSKLAVNNVSFTVPDGQVTGFLGPNGSGKSTTMRCMLGLDAPTPRKLAPKPRGVASLGEAPPPLQVT